ncbi:undecaprenyldiphospho-muramoylpentapeptide beta-N-acetylglucosaminyltransferase [Paenibacillus kobensis]|uniref:undecaprenyldiphospho-muramoylpentapeptide beta-N-acetylglucosaminyltransferase n=1 Tax=Paenibacillus kobensis TaxID=59841 RepID=UPI000FD96119|nr:undecaprenyldiphospho-muramoylpentapeptide beta-N-acetylglucosaminyltransferase [Paenibacillus kobensis]
MSTIMFTGGGSAGHVTVNQALIPRFLDEGWKVEYIGSENGIEKSLIQPMAGVRYHSIATGKLRRYFDWRNVTDPFKVVQGVWQAYFRIKRSKPNVLFSKGGFVSVPAVIGAWLNNVPVIIHESDVTPGLANRLSIPFARSVCTTFPHTASSLPATKACYVGPVVRAGLDQGNADRGRALCRFTDQKPVLLIMGGSLGARSINQAVRAALPQLIRQFQIVHLCGKGQLDDTIEFSEYQQFEFMTDELTEVLAMTDIVVTRAGANSIFEFLALSKPMLLIPLSQAQSRGDQLLNADFFEKSGYAEVLLEERLTPDMLLSSITSLHDNRERYIRSMAQVEQSDALSQLFDHIKQTAKALR